jgi:hypothetical protein
MKQAEQAEHMEPVSVTIFGLHVGIGGVPVGGLLRVAIGRLGSLLTSLGLSLPGSLSRSVWKFCHAYQQMSTAMRGQETLQGPHVVERSW